MKNLVEDIQKKNASAATNAITKALRAKTVAAIAEARKQVAVQMFGDLSEAPHQEHRRAEKKDKAPMKKGEMSQAAKDWRSDKRMAWPKDYGQRGSSSPLSGFNKTHTYDESEHIDEVDTKKLNNPICNNCAKTAENHPNTKCKKFVKWNVNMVGKKPTVDEGEKGNPRQDVRDMKKGLNKIVNRQMKQSRDQKFGKR
jgi:hypothetical protein